MKPTAETARPPADTRIHHRLHVVLPYATRQATRVDVLLRRRFASGERRLCKLAPKEVAYIHALSALTDATACQSRFINATSEMHLHYDYLRVKRCLHARTCIAYTYDIHVRDTCCNYTYVHVLRTDTLYMFRVCLHVRTGIAYLYCVHVCHTCTQYR